MIKFALTEMKHKHILGLILYFVLFNIISGSGFITMFIGSEKFNVEIARTGKEKSVGLMYRKGIPDNYGMLFVYSDEDIRGMWMKNTLINLDLIFLNSKKEVVEIIADVPPCLKDPCKSYISEYKAKYVLELKGQIAKELKLKTGDTIFFIL